MRIKHYILIVFTIFLFFSCKNENQITHLPETRNNVHQAETKEKEKISIDSTLILKENNKDLSSLYRSFDFHTIWANKKDREIILEELKNIEDEGINPKHFNTFSLFKYEQNFDTLNENEIISYDILLSKQLIKYLYIQTNGQKDPKTIYKDYDIPKNKIDAAQVIENSLKNNTLEESIQNTKPNHIVYLKLKNALKLINNYPNDYFKNIEIEKSIHLNDSTPLMLEIKKKLIYWGDLNQKDSLTHIYNKATKNAILKFQNRHGLAEDGIIGKETVRALNFSKKQRKNQIIANLERWRWYPKNLGDYYLIINIPDYSLRLVKNKDTIRTHKVIVGTSERKTPILSSYTKYVVFNPTWTVPPTILKEDVIPATLNNRYYLTNKNILVYDRYGNIVTPEQWEYYDATNYRYVQVPGTFNSLGMVKIIFPNRFTVFLHDTNNRDFFNKDFRSLSSGCIRVNNPMQLTEYLLSDPENYNSEKISEILDSGKTKNVSIKHKAKIHVLYWTAWSDRNTLIFRDDIYNLDSDLYYRIMK